MFSGVREVDGRPDLFLSVTQPVVINFWWQFFIVHTFIVALTPCSALTTFELLPLIPKPHNELQFWLSFAHSTLEAPEKETHVNLTKP
jgi:hypothetical protein